MSRKTMSFIDHLKELRLLMMISLIAIALSSLISYGFYETIVSFLYTPFENLNGGSRGDLLFLNTIFEGFTTRVKLSLAAGLLFSLPVHIFGVVRFVSPAMKKRERILLFSIICGSFILSALGILYSYFKLIPLSVSFLSGSSFVPGEVGVLLNFGRNIFYILQFLLVTLLLFQVPIVIEMLLALGVVGRRTLWRSSRYIIIGSFVLSAMLTPPDIISQVGLALPLVILYFGALAVAGIFRIGRA